MKHLGRLHNNLNAAALALAAGAMLAATPVHAQEAESRDNLIKNGSFEAGIEHWIALDIDKDETGKSTNIASNEDMLTWVKRDDSEDLTAGEDSTGALQVTFEGRETPDNQSHHTGARAELNTRLEKGKTYLVTFDARSVSGADVVKVARQWGGSKTETGGAKLSEDWASHTVRIELAHPTNQLIFSLTSGKPKPGIHRVADGVFLLDNITVTETEESRRAQSGGE